LGFHGVGGGAVESLDVQVLLDPAEEQFDLPTRPIQLGDRQREKGKEELIPAREILDVTVALVSIDAKLKIVRRNELHELSENRLTQVHRLPPQPSGQQFYGRHKEAKN